MLAADVYLTSWKVGPGEISGRQFKTLWFDDDLDGDLLVADKPKSTDKPTPFVLKGANDLYNEADCRMTNVTQIWQELIDDDNDPTIGRLRQGRSGGRGRH